MGVNIGGNTIALAGSVLALNTGVPMNLLTSGGVSMPNQTHFIAYGLTSPAAWVYPVSPSWNKMEFPNVFRNDDACYSTTLHRFTAPVDGLYCFQASLYLLKDAVTPGHYFHSTFWVNGGHAKNVNISYPNYRNRGHGWDIAGYAQGGGRITQIYSLIAGDYVEVQLYTTSGTGTNTNRHYPPYARFSGFLLG
jgi:hypothetical protein